MAMSTTTVVDMASEPAPLDEVVDLARPVVERVVWATVATVGADGRPRTRLMHPVWWWGDEAPTALVSARRTPLKVAHLAAQPVVSCFYWDPAHDTVALEADAAWVPAEGVGEAWARIAEVAPPVGFDPAMIWPDGPDDPGCAFLELTAHRVLATPAGEPGLRWDRGA